jgi:cyclophilin family peptidyl-prolyl cis-trans isomerase
MRGRGFALALVVLVPVFAGCAGTGAGPSTENPIEPCGQLDTSFEPTTEHNPRLRFETTNGTMTIVVYGQQVPFTAGHVNRLAQQEDTWEDTRFHQVFPDEAVFGGDPRSSNDDRDAWGSGGYHFNTVDEHHQFLRHDEPGIVSLLSPQPNGAGSQFVITLSPSPSLDDRNPVFGKVVEGLDTARELSYTPTDDRNRPLYGAHLENVTWIDPPEPAAPPPELSAYGYDCTEVAEPGDTAEHLITVRNTGPSILDGTMETSLDDVEGWGATITNAEQVVVSSGQTVVYGLNVTVPEDAETGTEKTFDVTFRGEESSTSLELTTRVGELGQPAVDQDKVHLRYIGVLEDGRAFDTTETIYVDEASLTWFKDPPAQPQAIPLSPSPETLNKTQPGDLIQRARLGETVVGFIAPEDAYGRQAYGENNLGGRLLVFQVQVTSAR